MDIKGFIRKEDGYVIPDQQLMEQRKQKILKASGIPSEYLSMGLEDFTIHQDASGDDLNPVDQAQKQKAYEITRSYIDNLPKILSKQSFSTKDLSGKTFNSQNLIFKGDGGSGKTLLATTILKSAMEYTPDGIYFSWTSFYDGLSNFDNKIVANQIEQKFLSKDIVILDGVSNYSFYPNSFFNRKVEFIINHRLCNKLPIIWTSYVNANELFKMFGPMTQSFIKDAIIVRLPSGNARENFKEI